MMAVMMRLRLTTITTFALLLWAIAAAQNTPGAGQGWMGEFEHSSKQLLALAQAMPADKFGWRPGPGVRSVSEVYMHIAQGNLGLLRMAGTQLQGEAASLPADAEKSVTAKADVIRWLRISFDAVRAAYPKAEMGKQVKSFGGSTVEGVYLRILVHNHEHMGQEVAYARMIGVVPPWSK